MRRHGWRFAAAALAIVVASATTTVTFGSSVPAAAAPGNPGVPSAPTVLYTEDFENTVTAAVPTDLATYVGTTGMTYTADTYWLNEARCNGMILSSVTPFPGNGVCNGDPGNWENVRAESFVLGRLNGTTVPGDNNALSTLTSGVDPTSSGSSPDGILAPADQDGREFAFAQQVTLDPQSVGRFLTFRVDAAAVYCFLAQPELRFYLRDANGAEIPLSDDPINPCVDPRSSQSTDVPVGGGTVYAGTYSADTAVLLSSPSVGVVLRNEQNDTLGNDAAIDDIQILDVTPQLDKSFSPTSVPAGGVSTLTFTVTNTSELAEKSGWAFTDSLPTGLVVAPTPSVGGTCAATTAAVAGGSSIAVTAGQLATGETSCTVTVDVTSAAPGPGANPSSVTYSNGPANITTLGLNAPATATVSFTRTAGISMVKSATPATISAAGQTIDYDFTVTNSGTTDLAQISITDTAFSGSGALSAISCPSATVAPGGSTVCTATYVATQGDIDAGSIQNTAFASGTSPAGQTVSSTPSSATVTAAAAPALTVAKSASVSGPAVVGRSFTYAFAITNTGNVTLTGVSPIETSFSGTGSLSAIACPAAASSLAPGAQVTCTASYTPTAADAAAGTIVNAASATGTPPGSATPPVAPVSTATVRVVTAAAGLAATGGGVAQLSLWAGAGLLLAGAAFLGVRRRRSVG